LETESTQSPESIEQKPVTLPALRFAFLLAAGLVLARFAWAWWPVPAAGFFIISLLYFLFRNKPIGRYLGEGAFFLLVILCAYGLTGLSSRYRQGETSHGLPLDTPVALTGRLVGPAWQVAGSSFDGTRRRRCVFKAETCQTYQDTERNPCDKLYLLTLPDDEEIPLNGNERLGLVAVLKKPSGYANPGGFDYRKYLLERSITAEAVVDNPEDVFLLGPGEKNLRSSLNPARWASALRAAVFERHGRLYQNRRVRAVASALLLGAREQLPRTLRNDFIDSGTMHVLVVSGLHVGFIAWALYLVFSLALGRGWACSIMVSAAVLFFALVCGGRPSVVRASVMCAFVLLALPLQRRHFLLNTLAAAFSLILLARPDWLTDIGFQLSFAAVTGIGLIVPRLEKIFRGKPWWRRRPLRWFVQLMLVSLAAQVAVTPLLAWYFLKISPAALFANILIVPLAGAAVITGFVADIFSFIWFPAARVAAWLFGVFTHTLVYLAGFFSEIPGASVEVGPPHLYDMVCWWLAAFLAASIAVDRKYFFRLVLVCLVWLNLIIWAPVAGLQGDEIKIRFLDIGRKGHAVVIQSPEQNILLLDSRGGTGDLPAREVIIPYIARFCGSGLDCLVLRNCNRASIVAASSVMERFEAGVLVIPPVSSEAPFYRHFLERCLSRGAAVRAVTAADTLSLGEAVLLSLGPGRYFEDYSERLVNTSAANLVQLVEYRSHRVLLAGAAGSRRLEYFFQEECFPGKKNLPGFELIELPARLGEVTTEELTDGMVCPAGGLKVIITEDKTYELIQGLLAENQGETVRLLSTGLDGSIGLRLRVESGWAVETER
jgi:ComEC/Rec2-related protein